MDSQFEIGDGTNVNVYPSQYGIEDILSSKLEATDRGEQEDPFFVVNLGRLAALYAHVGHYIILSYSRFTFTSKCK